MRMTDETKNGLKKLKIEGRLFQRRDVVPHIRLIRGGVDKCMGIFVFLERKRP